MWFFFSLIVSLIGFLLIFLPLPLPLYVPVGVAISGWLFTLAPRATLSTELRLRRMAGITAILTATIAAFFYLSLSAVVWML